MAYTKCVLNTIITLDETVSLLFTRNFNKMVGWRTRLLCGKSGGRRPHRCRLPHYRPTFLRTYSVRQKNPAPRTCGNFSKTVRNFSTKFYVPIMRSYLR